MVELGAVELREGKFAPLYQGCVTGFHRPGREQSSPSPLRHAHGDGVVRLTAFGSLLQPTHFVGRRMARVVGSEWQAHENLTIKTDSPVDYRQIKGERRFSC